jgi:hypothetical protein
MQAAVVLVVKALVFSFFSLLIKKAGFIRPAFFLFEDNNHEMILQ